MPRSRVAAIGLDAAEWVLIEEMLERGELPNFARLKERGVTCRFENGYASRSGLAWTQFLAGREISDRREWSTCGFDPATYEASEVPAHRLRPFYKQDPALQSIIFDVPHQTIVDGVTGAQVTAWGGTAPGYPRAARPRGLLREIDAEVGPHPGSNNDHPSGWHRSKTMDRVATALIEGTNRRVEVLRWLQNRVPDWELLLAVMSESHSAGEYLWHGVDPDHPYSSTHAAERSRQQLLEVYRALDDSFGQIVASLPSDTVLIVFSVHGMQSSHGDTPSLVLLPELLHRLHFGTPRIADPDQGAWCRAGFPPVQPPGGQKWGAYMSELFNSGSTSTWGAKMRARILRATPSPAADAARMVRRRINERGRNEKSVELSMRGVQGKQIPSETTLTPEEIDCTRSSLEYQPPGWYREFRPQMRAFALPSFSDGYIRVNLAGRERDGIVPRHEYEQVLEDVESELRACVNPRTGRSVVADVLRLRIDDPMDPAGPYPDLVVGWSDPIEAFEHPRVGMIGPFPLHRTGAHSPNGFAFIAGPGIEQLDLGTRSVLDLPPTILALLGRDVSNLEGTPLPMTAAAFE